MGARVLEKIKMLYDQDAYSKIAKTQRYAFMSGESVRVFCYPDRVEIHSSGLLLPEITVDQMERGEVQSKLRNPTLANLLKEIPGYMERLGSGIRFMLDETKRLGLPAPQF